MGEGKDNLCPVLRPTRAQFEKPFAEFVERVFKNHPDWPCFKVIPPKDWKPRTTKPNLENIQIATPIRQHAFGKAGAFQCILEEQKSITADEFKAIATAPSNQPPSKGHSHDDMLERAFWSSITMNPPLYGADTPISLFRKKLSYGWNLRNLNCLFKDYDVPQISGVTSPMTYFGMWRSFFGWHKEDVDLYSVNYNHFGAAKIWYCVSPKDAQKFDTMAKALFPEAHRQCPAFMRHKDIIISPKTLRAYNVPYVQARQEHGEFIVLNAAAYHAGFNLGFNCAEAVNFALPAWLEVGRDCISCECDALPDSVTLDMGIFFPELREDSSSDDDDDFTDAEEGEYSDDEEEEEEESEEEEEESEPEQRDGNKPRVRKQTTRQQQYQRQRQVEKRSNSSTKSTVEAGKSPGKPSRKPTSELAGGSGIDGGKVNTALGVPPGALLMMMGKRPRGRPPKSPAAVAKAARRMLAQLRASKPGNSANKRTLEEALTAAAAGATTPVKGAKRQRLDSSATRGLFSPFQEEDEEEDTSIPRSAVHPLWGSSPQGQPLAWVEEDGDKGGKTLKLVQRLYRQASRPHLAWFGELQEGEDGLFRPTKRVILVPTLESKLVKVRTEWSDKGRRGGWKLLTPRRRVM